jgi:hypothetical protein
MSRLFSCFVFLASLLFATHTMAANACYDEAQAHAEQLLRLHSELMVITVTCRQGSGGQSLPAAYGAFTHKNITVLHDAEGTLTDYYGQHAKGNPVEHLDRLRTILANEFGEKSATMGSGVFCETYRDRVVKMESASSSDVENEAEKMGLSHPTLVHPCGAKGK